jgi:hypothetical protein
MRKRMALMCLVAAALANEAALNACGDKLIMVGRGMKFRSAYSSVYPGHILIFARPTLSAKAAIRDPQFHRLLRQAGHAVSVIENPGLLEQALQTVAIDLVLVDLEEAPALTTLAAASPSHPTVIPVLFASSPASKLLQQQYACKLKANDRSIHYLDEIENQMEARVKARRAPKS